MKIERELMRGAGPVAVLRLLEPGEKYGYELVQALERQTGGVLAMGQSTLYPLLYNLEAKGLVTRERDVVDVRSKRVAVTAAGVKTLRRALPIAIAVQERLFGDAGRPGGHLLAALLPMVAVEEPAA